MLFVFRVNFVVFQLSTRLGEFPPRQGPNGLHGPFSPKVYCKCHALRVVRVYNAMVGRSVSLYFGLLIPFPRGRSRERAIGNPSLVSRVALKRFPTIGLLGHLPRFLFVTKGMTLGASISPV